MQLNEYKSNLIRLANNPNKKVRDWARHKQCLQILARINAYALIIPLLIVNTILRNSNYVEEAYSLGN